MDLQLIRELAEFDGALLANTLSYIDDTPPEDIYFSGEIRSLMPGMGSMVGLAVTCELDSSSPGGPAKMEPYFQLVEEIQASKLPVVWVVKAAGSRPQHECILGDGMAKLLRSAGCVGTVTDGGVRDVAGCAGIRFPVFARGTVIHHTALRVRRTNEPVEIGGLTIRNGDLIHGSDEGVIRIPNKCAEMLPPRAIKMRAFEQDAHRVFLRADLTAKEKAARVGTMLEDYGFSK